MPWVSWQCAPAVFVLRVVLSEQQQVVVCHLLGHILLHTDAGNVKVTVLAAAAAAAAHMTTQSRV